MTTSDSSQATSQTSSQPAVSDQGAPAVVPTTATAPGPAAAAPAKVETPPAAATSVAATPEPKPVETAKPAAADPAKPAESATAVAPVIPETYTLPEIKGIDGKAIAIDPALIPVMGPAFKAAGLTQDAVNGLVKTFVDFQTQLPTQMLARDLEVTMKDPDLGQMNWGKTQGHVNEALAAFTTPEFRSKLERWGIANDLEFVRVFASIGRAMRGDIATRGAPSTAPEESRADRMYGRATKIGQS